MVMLTVVQKRKKNLQQWYNKPLMKHVVNV